MVRFTPPQAARALVRRLHEAGWRAVRHNGGHVVFSHPKRGGMVAIPMHPAGWRGRSRIARRLAAQVREALGGGASGGRGSR